MPSNFSSLRNSSRQNALAKLNDELKKESNKQGADERFWKLTVDSKTKVGFARLRFLPAPAGEDVPWQRIFNHAFKLNGSWFIENCPTTLGDRPCPVCKANSELWNAPGSDKDGSQDVARERKRKLQYISNILVIDDPAHAENNGKVFLFKYGKKIHDKIQEQINPQFPDQVPTNPFEMWADPGPAGGDFKLKAQNLSGFQNYDKSEFTEPKELFPGDDTKKEELWDKEYPLMPLVSAEQFKSYEDIEKRFKRVILGTQGPATAADAIKNEQPTQNDADEGANLIEAAEQKQQKAAAQARKPRTPKPEVKEPIATVPDTEDDIRAFFTKMVD